MRSATSRCTIITNRSGRGSSPRTWWRMGLLMWYGTLATSVQGASTSSASGTVEEIGLHQAQAGIVGEALAEVTGQAPVELDGGDLRAAAEQRGGEDAKARTDLDDALAGSQRGDLDDALEDGAVGEVVLGE